MMDSKRRTTVSICKDTKIRMDKWRADGQCYDGFLSQLIELWERMHAMNGNHHK
jgi:hypothetical protein